MNVWLMVLLVALALFGVLFWIVKSRSRDIEEVILQGRPVLLRCGKDRVQGRSGGCGECDTSLEGC